MGPLEFLSPGRERFLGREGGGREGRREGWREGGKEAGGGDPLRAA